MSLDKFNVYKGKELLITDGFIHPPFRYDEKIPKPLEQSVYFNATDGVESYEILDIRRQLKAIITAKQSGETEVVLGISRSRKEADCYISSIEVIGY